ncbi:g11211 [Coccomyxa viridis]|uniref:G11211 protein n=1 Tax=Coccomyxa viridis TaxID=1274662 RepID=A0ABP1G7Q7_9CHLO
MHSAHVQLQRPVLRPQTCRRSSDRSVLGRRRPMMTHIPAALQHCLALQSALLFNWDGDEDRYGAGEIDPYRPL